mgnify:CR=1 FL=1
MDLFAALELERTAAHASADLERRRRRVERVEARRIFAARLEAALAGTGDLADYPAEAVR